MLAKGVEVFFCSAKTLSEQVRLAEALGVDVGLIGENGGVVRERRDTEPVMLGVAYSNIRDVLSRVRSELAVEVSGYGDLSTSEIAKITGLDLTSAGLAKERDCSETLVDLEPHQVEHLRDALVQHGLRLSRGARFWTIQGDHDKGTAIRMVTKSRESVTSFGVGDSHNDQHLLEVVDHPMLVRSHDGDWARLDVPGLVRLDGVGPEGWVLAADAVLANTD